MSEIIPPWCLRPQKETAYYKGYRYPLKSISYVSFIMSNCLGLPVPTSSAKMSKMLGLFLKFVGSALCGVVVGTLLPGEGWSGEQLIDGLSDGTEVDEVSAGDRNVGFVETGSNVFRMIDGEGMEDEEYSNDISQKGLGDFEVKRGFAVGVSNYEKGVFDVCGKSVRF